METVPKANPLLEDRTKLETECLRLVRQVAEAMGEDPVEVMARASEHKGRAKLNPATMTDDRLLHTVRALRLRCSALKASSQTEASQVAQAQRIDGLSREFGAWFKSEKREGETVHEARLRFLALRQVTLSEDEQGLMVVMAKRYVQ